MLTTTMKYAAIVTLLAGMFWHLAPNLRSYLDFVVVAGAVFALVQAINLRKYWWVAGFVALIFLFNPVRPVAFSFAAKMAMQIVGAAVLAASLQILKAIPRLTIASIAEANPRIEAL